MNQAQALRDQQPDQLQFLEHVHEGLGSQQKWLSPMYLYDAAGSQLFDRICELDEYYPTRTEQRIIESQIAEIANAVGPRALVVEPGSGSSLKTRTLLAALAEPAGYVPVEISREHLLDAVAGLREVFPKLPILPVCADFTLPLDIPAPDAPPRQRVIFFPGSTIGNFPPSAAVALLTRLREAVSPGDGLLIGVDLQKDSTVLERAYNDAEGVTARFNLNLLRRMNRELSANFDLSRFAHRAVWNGGDGRIEMHLVSRGWQRVRVGKRHFDFEDGEYILSECSYKYTLDTFAELAAAAGWQRRQVWTDPLDYFSLQYFASAAD